MHYLSEKSHWPSMRWKVLAMVTVHTFLNPQMRASSLQTGSIVAHSPNCVWVTIHFFLSTQS